MTNQTARTETTQTLGELARQAARGRKALEALLPRCRPIVYALVLDRVHHPDLAEDLTQETLADVAQALPRLRDPSAFVGWLKQVAINRCRMWWRRAQVAPEPLSEEYQRLVHEDMFAEAARRERLRELLRALEDLPDKSRLALLMHVLGGLSHEQVAEALELTPGAVAVRIHRARLRLRALLTPIESISEEEWENAD